MMPVKQLNAWRGYYKDAMFVNLYGPTEITCNCTYYIIDREYSDDEKLPMGNAFLNEHVFLLDDDNSEIIDRNIPGEVCVSGTALALGYYNNKEATAKAFVQNPLMIILTNLYTRQVIWHTTMMKVCLYFREEKISR